MRAGAPRHVPVLVAEVLERWLTDPSGAYVDGTAGGGGHDEALLSRLDPGGRLLAVDRDPAALEAARERLRRFGDRVQFRRARFSALREVAEEEGFLEASGVLLDLGLSSLQLEDPDRGFSHRFPEGSLEMAMDGVGAEGASDVLNRLPAPALAEMFRRYGELRAAKRLARRIAERRAERPFRKVSDFLAALEGAGVRGPKAKAMAFQALRIAVNDELGELDRGLKAAREVLAPGGVLVVLSYHSLEDARVRDAFRPPGVLGPGRLLRQPLPPPWIPLTRKPVRPSAAEIAANPRSRSARLRAARKNA
jgi:16S rRNA (cytosine1402-N4)-methyltransferase